MLDVHVVACTGAKCLAVQGPCLASVAALVSKARRMLVVTVLEVRVVAGAPFEHYVKLLFQVGEAVATSVLRWIIKYTQVDAWVRDWEERVVDAECCLVRLQGSRAWMDKWRKLMEELSFRIVETNEGYFWASDAFAERHAVYERCSLLVALEIDDECLS